MGNMFTAPDTPQDGVQIHCVISYHGLGRRVEIGQGYIEGTLTRRVVEGGEEDVESTNELEAPTTTLVTRKASSQGTISPFDPATDTLDVCESLCVEVEVEGGVYDDIVDEWEEEGDGELLSVSAEAPAVVINPDNTGMFQQFEAVLTGGIYDEVSYMWDLIPPIGSIGSGSVPIRAYIPPREVETRTTITVICVVTVTGRGTNAAAGTRATARVAQYTFELLPTG